VTMCYESCVCGPRSKVDPDDSGSIEQAELASMLAGLGFSLNEAQCNALMTKVDANGDGSVSVRSFFKVDPPLGALC
jgi:Ca2+-binding EF-hand superfamily protein